MPTLNGGTWNMERDRDPAKAAAAAIALMDEHELDFLCIQECAHYLQALRAAARDTYELIAFTGDPGRRESAIIVRRDVAHGRGYQVRLTKSGWVTVRGGHTPPKYLTTVMLDGWLRVACGHTAPSVRWPGGRITGPIRRVISMRQFARRVVRFAGNHREALLIACDWNATPGTRGRWSPRWIAYKARLRFATTHRGTHGSRVIDFALYRGCIVTTQLEHAHGSDHRAVLFTVRSTP